MSRRDPALRAREPLVNAPAPPALMAGLLLLLFLAQTLAAGPDVFDQFALIPARVAAGDGAGLLTHMFLHGGWAHLTLNALGLLAFGTAVARLFGPGPKGVGLFLGFYLTCGMLAGFGFVALHPGAETPVVGASGAVAGLMAGASRLIEHPGRLSPFRSRPVVAMASAWLAINAIAAVFGTLPGAGGAAIAWEAHLAGYAAGLLLIGPFARLARMRR